MLGVYFLFLLSLSAVGFSENTPRLSRDDFPPGFVFGAGTSAYQAEGAVAEDGRSPSIWDTFAHAGKAFDGSNADVSSGQYHKYKEDVKLMSDVGIDAYRFSISWSRLIPNGRGAVNPKGLQYYNNLINELVSRGIQPHVTIYHLDLPQILEDEYGGWLSPKIVEDFTAYADVCFREFGDRVAHWTTVNQPNIMAIAAYDSGMFPPGRCSGFYSIVSHCTAGNSSVEPYIVVHHSLLAHASAATLYRQKYQAKQNGLLGINVYGIWFIPLTNSTADIKASQRALDFYSGWIMHPVVYGDYPEVMKKNVGSRIPSFTKLESEQIKGSFDFIGVNHYLTMYAEDDSDRPTTNMVDFNTDMYVKFRASKDSPSGQASPFNTQTIPSGLTNMLEYFQNEYGNPPIYIQENGHGGLRNETLNDTARIEYLTQFVNATLIATRKGSNAKGYFVWSFMDVFEFLAGYQARYGLFHVDFNDKDLTRRPKFSARWYSKLLKKGKKINIERASSRGIAQTLNSKL